MTWSTKGTTPIVKVATTGSALPTTLGAISTAGIGNIALRKPKPQQSKKRCNGSTPGVQRLYLVMDNAPIHQYKDIEFAIKQLWSVATVAYTSPPYSPELSPIEQLCPKVKRHEFNMSASHSPSSPSRSIGIGRTFNHPIHGDFTRMNQQNLSQVSLYEYNRLVEHTAKNSKSASEDVLLALSGIDGQRHLDVLPCPVPVRPDAFVQYDIDSVVLESEDPPVKAGNGASLYVCPWVQDVYCETSSFGRVIEFGSEDDDEMTYSTLIPYGQIPNRCLAYFGDSGHHFKMNVFFALAIGYEGDKKNRLSEEMNIEFVDSLLLPCLRKCVSPFLQSQVPLSYRHAMTLQRQEGGQLSLLPTKIPGRDLKKATQLMRQVIGENENLAVYQDFFVSYAHGLKCPVTKLSDFSEAFKNEIDMAVAHGETSKLYLDYAIEMLPSDGSNVCGVWLNNAFPSVGDIKCHMAALSPFFPSKELFASRYRYHGVLGFRSLASCGYKASPSVDGSGELGVHSVKMYSSFKRPFYHRKSGGYNHTKDLSAYDVWAYERRAEEYISFTRSTADGMSGQAFPARLEVTVTHDVAWEDQDHLMLLMREVISKHSGFIPTKDVCDLMLNRLYGLELVTQNLKSQARRRSSAAGMSLAVLVAYVASGLTGRPKQDYYYDKVHARCLRSTDSGEDLLFLPYLLQTTPSGDFLCTDAFNTDVLQDIFFTKYNTVSTVPRGATTNAINTRPLCLLEYSFGFVTPSAGSSSVSSSVSSPVVGSSSLLSSSVSSPVVGSSSLLSSSVSSPAACSSSVSSPVVAPPLPPICPHDAASYEFRSIDLESNGVPADLKRRNPILLTQVLLAISHIVVHTGEITVDRMGESTTNANGPGWRRGRFRDYHHNFIPAKRAWMKNHVVSYLFPSVDSFVNDFAFSTLITKRSYARFGSIHAYAVLMHLLLVKDQERLAHRLHKQMHQ
ncbi:hypothetical protein [Absidia glauca]|uniref:Tc1-like transposase DDE domain-containing protein n=1 Tax=Absidia glauca TaxID=4829 RepID=A0A163J742_ABSGL|nr:hypothetical protein [Absidia glauca]